MVSVTKIASMLEKPSRTPPSRAAGRRGGHRPVRPRRRASTPPTRAGCDWSTPPTTGVDDRAEGVTTMPRTPTPAPVLADPVSAELKAILRNLKLGKLLDTLPDRLALARQQQLPHADFLELVLADEVTRRDTNSAALRARAAGLDPAMRLDTWDPQRRRPVRHSTVERTVQPAVRRRRPRRPRPRPGRRRQDPPGHRARAHRRAPTPQRPHGPRRQTVQTTQGRPARPHPRRRDAPPPPRPVAHHRRLLPARPRRDRDRRLLRDRRRTTPQDQHRDHVQPRRRTSGSRTWPTRCWPSPPSTGSPRPPTSSSSKASPTANANDPDATHRNAQPRPRAGPERDHIATGPAPHRPSRTDRDALRIKSLTPPRPASHPHHAARWSLGRGNRPVPSSWQATDVPRQILGPGGSYSYHQVPRSLSSARRRRARCRGTRTGRGWSGGTR